MYSNYGYSMWNGCVPSSFHVDIPSFHVEFGHSITIPYGIHMESMWNGDPKMGGMSAKIHSIWNGGLHMESMWNEVHSMWSPCGVHVEYGGRVKTSSFGI